MTNIATDPTAADLQPVQFEHWIDGGSRRPQSGDYLDSFNPANGQLTARIARGNAADVALAADAASCAQHEWAALPPVDRSRALNAVADVVRANMARLLELELAETGKPRNAAAFELAQVADYLEYYAGLIRGFHGHTVERGPGQHTFTSREPYGVVGIITPWNGALNQCLRGAAPALAAGNTVVVKPSEFTSTTTAEFARLTGEAGLPAGVFNVVTGTGSEVGAFVVQHPAVRRISFTGSVVTGKAIAHAAAERLIPVTLELGGKSPHIIFADADLERATAVAVQSFTANAGQYCAAGTRLIVQSAVYDEVVQKLVSCVSKIVVGDEMGPIITDDQFAKVQQYFNTAEEDGARLEAGGRTATDGALAAGNYIQPTIYSAVTNEMRIAREEIFGPVLAVIRFDTEAEAVAIANDSPYGLAAGLWTESVNTALRVAPQLEAGQVYVNTWGAGVETPFGGYKDSGYGREKGEAALDDYTQLKTTTIQIY